MPLFQATTTAQNVMDAVAQDVRQTLNSTQTPDSNILLDYVNRVSLDLQRISQFQFLLSAPQHFVTQLDVTDYWLGPAAGNGFGQFDTGLHLSDIRIIKDGSVIDRSNFRPLGRTEEAPNSAKLAYPDDTSRTGRPAEWRCSQDTPNVLNIYPAPDNQNTFQPVPDSPIWKTDTSGALPNRIYWVTTTFVDSLGNESTAPRPARVFVPAGQVLVISPPQEPLLAGTTGIQYDRYNVYASATDEGSVAFQDGPLSTGAAWTEPDSGLIAGDSPPGDNAVEPIDGYIIEFRYYRQRVQIVAPTDVLQIPDDYKDVVIEGVKAYAFTYLTRPQEAAQAFGLYRQGVVSIVRDLNWRRDFVRPDASSISGNLSAVESIDLSVLLS